MSISQPTRRAVDRLRAGLHVFFSRSGQTPTLEHCGHMADALHDLLVCVLVDHENEKREQPREPLRAMRRGACPFCDPEQECVDHRH